MIAIFPADSGSLSATFPITATWSPSSITIGRRSRTTAPPSVWMNVVSSSSRRTSWRCVLVVTSTHTVCTRGRSSAASAARSAPERARPARTGASACCAGGSRSAIAASTSTFSNNVSTDLAATCVRISSFSIMFARDRLEAVLVQGRVLDVVREHPHEREQDRQDRENTGDDDAPTRRPAGRRVLFGFAHHGGVHLLTSRQEVHADQGSGPDCAQDEHGDDACDRTEERSHGEIDEHARHETADDRLDHGPAVERLLAPDTPSRCGSAALTTAPARARARVPALRKVRGLPSPPPPSPGVPSSAPGRRSGSLRPAGLR